MYTVQYSKRTKIGILKNEIRKKIKTRLIKEKKSKKQDK